MAWSALPRRISPVGTPFDGDVVFALATGPLTREIAPAELLALGTVAQRALEEAITGAVRDQPTVTFEG